MPDWLEALCRNLTELAAMVDAGNGGPLEKNTCRKAASVIKDLYGSRVMYKKQIDELRGHNTWLNDRLNELKAENAELRKALVEMENDGD